MTTRYLEAASLIRAICYATDDAAHGAHWRHEVSAYATRDVAIAALMALLGLADEHAEAKGRVSASLAARHEPEPIL